MAKSGRGHFILEIGMQMSLIQRKKQESRGLSNNEESPINVRSVPR